MSLLMMTSAKAAMGLDSPFDASGETLLVLYNVFLHHRLEHAMLCARTRLSTLASTPTKTK